MNRVAGKPRCPVCGYSAPRYEPWESDKYRRPIDYRAPVTIACEVEGASAAWECGACGLRFGEGLAPRARVAERSIAEWRALVETMLPKPVRADKAGALLGGEPPVVMVRVDEAGIVVSRAHVAWPSPSHPTIEGVTIAKFSLRVAPLRVSKAVMRAWAVSRHRWCPSCFQVCDPGHMFGVICQGCATYRFGVVY